jgi:hypothetical protein
MGAWMSGVETMPTVVFAVAVQACVMALLFWNQRHGVEARRWSGVLLVGVYGVSAGVAYAVTGLAVWLVPSVLFSLGLAVPLCVGMKHDSVARPLTFANGLLSFIFISFIACRWFVKDFPPSASLARTLIFIPWAVALCLGMFHVVHRLRMQVAGLHPVFRRQYQRPTRPLPPRREPPFPRVTVHIPCYAEPPELVIATLDAVSRLNYPAFDVIVVDNNTKDPALWRPVEAHCARLGERFRFVHVDALPGAKGGALNLALRLTPKETQVVAVLDADYVCEPDFLEALVGYFDDPAIDFVQTPHDYREWQGRWFLQGSHWEERHCNLLPLLGLSEMGLALIVGTMCLIRRDALEAVGGWSETCLTEDTELAFRLSARGGKGVFLPTTFGRGLLPGNFFDLQKQRFRWSAGPIQQVLMHWRALLPGQSPGMSAMYRRVWALHCLDAVPGLVLWLLSPVGISGLVLLVLQGQRVPLPPEFWVFMGTGFVFGGAEGLLRSRLLGCSVRDMVAAGLLGPALSLTRRYATLMAFFARRPLAWQRTNKFQGSARGWKAALGSCRVELCLGGGLVGLAGAMWPLVDLAHPDLFLLVCVGALTEGLRQFCAPFVALVSDAELRREAKARSAHAAVPIQVRDWPNPSGIHSETSLPS